MATMTASEERSPANDDDDLNIDIFTEPADYFRPTASFTTETHTLNSGQVLSLRLVGQNPLWGHLLWNAARTISHHLERHAASLIADKTVLELGAGAGLPGLVCGLLGAKRVLITDYPDADLIENLEFNRVHCSRDAAALSNVSVTGHLWGADPTPLLAKLPPSSSSGEKEEERQGYDLVILADVLFNHSQHAALLASVSATLSRRGPARALVFFTPYRPWLLDRDLAFFDLARAAGFVVEKVLEERMDEVMFEEDPGDETLRRTVFGYEMRWK